MNSQSARKLAEKVLGTGNKGFLIVVFPEDKENFSAKDVSFATNANNDVVLTAATLVVTMVMAGDYHQEILGEGQLQLPYGDDH